ncbi:DnaD domain protein [Bacillus sp. 03113]|uniref:DnaD domain protein n=1 Tax=Bacillus sp. 03113 TaxID=2578211 RepID=UPI001141452D|nr:DnaD domain protein [Bacillus sp. 03113]
MERIEELNAFYDRLETNPLPLSAISLFHSLMYIRDKHGLVDWFAVSISALCTKSCISESNFFNIRNKLKQEGYIDFSSRGGNQSAKYLITVCTTKSIDQNSGQQKTLVNTQVDESVNPPVNVQVNRSALLEENRKIDRQIEVTWANIMDSWKEVFNQDMRLNHSQMLGAYIDHDNMTEALLLEAIERVRQADKPVFSYLWKTLSNWAKAGVKTMGDLLEFEKNRDSDSPSFQGKNSSKKTNSTLDFLEDYKKRKGIG